MPTCFLQRLQLDLERPAELGVQRAERLVEQQHRRLQDQRPGQRHPLLLAAGQLARPALLERPQLHQFERGVDALLKFGLRQLLVPQAEGDVVEDRQEREQGVALEHRVHVAAVRRDGRYVLAVQQDPARGRLLESGDQPQRRRLAAARWAKQGEELTAVDLQVDVVHGDLVEPLGQRYELDPASGHPGTYPSAASCWLAASRPRPGVQEKPS